ncbi:hypothetical protein Dimus_014482 [Dionaea muscipula]
MSSPPKIRVVLSHGPKPAHTHHRSCLTTSQKRILTLNVALLSLKWLPSQTRCTHNPNSTPIRPPKSIPESIEDRKWSPREHTYKKTRENIPEDNTLSLMWFTQSKSPSSNVPNPVVKICNAPHFNVSTHPTQNPHQNPMHPF